MEQIKEIAVVFCAAAVLSGGFKILNGGVLGKSAEFVFSLLLLTSILTSFASKSFSFDLKFEETSLQIETTAAAISEYEAEYMAGQILMENDIKYKKITAIATKTEDGGIVINEIRIKGVEESERAVAVLEQSGICQRIKTE